MIAIQFDTLKLAKRLQSAGFTAQQADATAEALAETVGADLVTKDFFQVEMRDLRAELHALEQRMTIKLGGMMIVAVGAVATLTKLLYDIFRPPPRQ